MNITIQINTPTVADFLKNNCKSYELGTSGLYRVVPSDTYTDHMDFDREACAAGLKEFTRPAFPNEPVAPSHIKPLSVTDIHVTEVQPGFRSREMSVQVK